MPPFTLTPVSHLWPTFPSLVRCTFYVFLLHFRRCIPNSRSVLPDIHVLPLSLLITDGSVTASITIASSLSSWSIVGRNLSFCAPSEFDGSLLIELRENDGIVDCALPFFSHSIATPAKNQSRKIEMDSDRSVKSSRIVTCFIVILLLTPIFRLLVVAGRQCSRVHGRFFGKVVTSVRQRRWPDEIVRSANVVLAAHRRRALATSEQIWDQEIAVRIPLPQSAVGVLVADLAEFRR